MRFKIFIWLVLPFASLAQGNAQRNTGSNSLLKKSEIDAAVSAAATTYAVKSSNLSDLTDASAARTNLGLSTTANLSSTTNKNFVTDAQSTVIGNTSGTNSGDNAANSTYANDYRAANFVAGTNYLAPGGSAAALTNNTGGWTELHVSGSNATTTGQTLVDVTGLTSGTLTNSVKYEFEAILDVTTSAVTTGCQYGVFCGGSGGAGVISAILEGTTTGTTGSVEVFNTTPATASSARLLTSGQSGTIVMRGFITTRGSGTATISIQHLKVTSGTSTVKTGSVFRYRIAQ